MSAVLQGRPTGSTRPASFDIEAHRGGRALRPENTLQSFANALSMGVDTLELDMGVTKDGVIVVSHERGLNPDLARAPDGLYVPPPGIPYVKLTLVEVKKYDVGQIRPGSDYAARFPDQLAVPGTRIPTLAEVFELVRRSGDRHVHLNIETKIDPNHPDESPDPEHFVAVVLDLLQREDFAERIKAGAPIGAHEILYPFNQAYDSVAVEADLEVGGTDQLFNLLFGREIQKAYGQKPQDIAVFPLLVGTDGVQKMSKSLGNYIGISEPPDEIYGKTMSIPDQLIEKYLRLISSLSPAEVEAVLRLKPRDAKAALARQLVKRLHGEEAAARAEEDFNVKFRKRDIPEELPDRTVSDPQDIVGSLVAVEFAKTRGDAKRLIDQGGVRVNGEKATIETVLHGGDVLQAGKRNFVRIRLK